MTVSYCKSSLVCRYRYKGNRASRWLDLFGEKKDNCIICNNKLIHELSIEYKRCGFMHPWHLYVHVRGSRMDHALKLWVRFDNADSRVLKASVRLRTDGLADSRVAPHLDCLGVLDTSAAASTRQDVVP